MSLSAGMFMDQIAIAIVSPADDLQFRDTVMQ